MISLNNLTVSFGGWDLFRDITFMINPKDRIGLVGKNGAGKSTLLKVLTGEQPPSSGQVSCPADCTLGYLPQQMKVSDGKTVIEETATAFDEVNALEKEIARLTDELSARTDYESEGYADLIHRLNETTDRFHMLGGDNREAEMEKTLLGLGFERKDFGRPTQEFSGGWRMRVELAKLLLRRPSVFLLDEPTNHLDIESIQWLENYLKDYPGSVVLISHDRAFLDAVTNRTVELSLGRITDYKVSYSKYVELRRERREQQAAAYENQQKLIEKTEEFIERFRYKPTKSNQVQSRIKQLDKLDRLELDEEDFSRMSIKFPPAPRSGQVVVESKNVGKSFGEKHIFSGADFVIERGEKIALVGRNGEGKTTYARIVVGDTDATEGELRVGHNVNIGYFAQNQDDLMDGDATVFDTLDRVAVGDIRTRLRDILGAFLFRGEDIDKKVRVLSGGERSRLAMARLMLEPYNLLVLDEPTNHMDMRSKDILKEAIIKYDGTVLVVSHDREFLDGLVGKVYEFRDGLVKEHLGGIYDFLEKKRMASLQELERKKEVEKQVDAVSEPALSAKEQYQEKQKRDRLLKSTRSDIRKIEEDVERLESGIAEWDVKLADPSAHGIDLSDSSVFEGYNDLKAQLAKAMKRWEELHFELEILETT